jgi:hypothetical protein
MLCSSVIILLHLLIFYKLAPLICEIDRVCILTRYTSINALLILSSHLRLDFTCYSRILRVSAQSNTKETKYPAQERDPLLCETFCHELTKEFSLAFRTFAFLQRRFIIKVAAGLLFRNPEALASNLAPKPSDISVGFPSSSMQLRG